MRPRCWLRGQYRGAGNLFPALTLFYQRDEVPVRSDRHPTRRQIEIVLRQKMM